MKTRYAFGISVAVCIAVGTAAAVSVAASNGADHNCHSTMPAYSAPTPNQIPLWVGEWTLNIDNGNSTLLPNGDTATCHNGEIVTS